MKPSTAAGRSATYAPRQPGSPPCRCGATVRQISGKFCGLINGDGSARAARMFAASFAFSHKRKALFRREPTDLVKRGNWGSEMSLRVRRHTVQWNSVYSLWFSQRSSTRNLPMNVEWRPLKREVQNKSRHSFRTRIRLTRCMFPQTATVKTSECCTIVL